jgi:hypothetical protein
MTFPSSRPLQMVFLSLEFFLLFHHIIPFHSFGFSFNVTSPVKACIDLSDHDSQLCGTQQDLCSVAVITPRMFAFCARPEAMDLPHSPGPSTVPTSEKMLSELVQWTRGWKEAIYQAELTWIL